MKSIRPSRGAQRMWLAVSVVLFLGAAYFVAIGHREFHHWLLLLGSFSNAMVFWLLLKQRQQPG